MEATVPSEMMVNIHRTDGFTSHRTLFNRTKQKDETETKRKNGVKKNGRLGRNTRGTQHKQ
jgi:hypothetical protein